MIAFQCTKPFHNLTGLTMSLVAAVLLTSGSQAAEANLSDLFANVNPTVVEIRTLSSSSLPPENGTTPTSEMGLGSGVLIAHDQVLTASHVVEIEDRIQVRLVDGTTRRARVTSSERFADVSLLTPDAPVSDIEPVTLGDSDRTRVGDRVAGPRRHSRTAWRRPADDRDSTARPTKND